MVHKKLDNRIRTIIENGVKSNHRSMLCILGPKGKDQVPILHQMLTKSQVKTKPSVLWCYKKELGFSTHRKKRMAEMAKKQKAGLQVDEDNPFDFFISATTIRWTYYKESHKILGNTFGMLVLQDFEAITPNLLARTIETIEGGGIIVFLMSSLESLQQLHTMAMDVHDRYRTDAHQDVVSRFNERFLLSLTKCQDCLVIDDKLNVIPIHSFPIEPLEAVIPDAIDPALRDLKDSLEGVEPAQTLVSQCKTMDQARALLKFVEVLSDKTLKHTVSLTAGRGRGKSASLGLAIVAAVGFQFSNIVVTSPSPENLKTLFEFVLKGLEAIHYQQHLDYEVIHSTDNEETKSVVRINIFKDHRQCIQYVNPEDMRRNRMTTSAAELVVIDEAAAIPLPIVKKFLGPHLVFMASTINGYEGTGRSLSLKLLKQLRAQSVMGGKNKETGYKLLHEITLEESIRYKMGDRIEGWLNHLLCLDAEVDSEKEKADKTTLPDPKTCSLYYINRDTLFSYHEASESFLQKLVALYVASHYKNTPNDLQMMSDAPGHHLFALLPPMKESDKAKGKIPHVLCFIQVGLEGLIKDTTLQENTTRGKRASGDLIPWTVSQQFQDNKFAQLAGARIIRIATNPSFQGMGYGSVAMSLLEDYYKGLTHVDGVTPEVNPEHVHRKEVDDEGDEPMIRPRTKLPPLLVKLCERKAEHLDYMGVSFGLTPELFKFWKRNHYIPCYVRQTANDLTGEHSCIVLKIMSPNLELDQEDQSTRWLREFSIDFQKRFVNLLGFQFRSFTASLALNVINSCHKFAGSFKEMNKQELEAHITLYDLKRLEMYSQNLVDYHLITDLMPTVARLYFTGKIDPSVNLSIVQCVILLSIGAQFKTVEDLEEELKLPSSQILGLFNRSLRKIATSLKGIQEKAAEGLIVMPDMNRHSMAPMNEDLNEELNEAADEVKSVERKMNKKLSKELNQFRIRGSEDDWNRALTGKQQGLISIKSIAPKRPMEESKGGKGDATGGGGGGGSEGGGRGGGGKLQGKGNKKKKFKKHHV